MISVKARVTNQRVDTERKAKYAKYQTDDPGSISSSFLNIGQYCLSAMRTHDFSRHISKNKQSRCHDYCISIHRLNRCHHISRARVSLSVARVV
jgi:hypothetical protein